MSGADSRTGVAVSIAACMVVGAVPLLQPLLLGEMARLGRLTTAQIGQAAMFETLGMALTTLLGALFLSRLSLRRLGAVCGLSIAAVNVVTGYASGEAVLLCRFLAGAFSGILVWIFWTTMARQASATRLTATYVVLEAAFSGVLGLLFSVVVAPRLGPSGAYFVLAALSGLVGIACMIGGPERSKGKTQHSGLPLPNLAGFFGILAVGCHLGGIMAFWVYAPLVAQTGGIALQTAQIILSLAVFGHILGGAIAFLIAPRIKPETALALAIVGTAATISIVMVGGPWVFGIATLTFAVFWLMSPAFHMGLLLKLDDTGHSAALIGTAQLGGVSVGPLASSLVITAFGPSATQVTGIGLLMAALVFGAIALTLRSKPRGRRAEQAAPVTLGDATGVAAGHPH